MMNCGKTKKYLMDYLDGKLNPRNQNDLLAHLEICSKCQDAWGYQIQLANELSLGTRKFKKDLEVPSSLLYDILREIRNVPEPQPIWSQIWNLIFRLPAYAHAVLIVTLSALITLSAITIEDVGLRQPRKLEVSSSAYLWLAKSESVLPWSGSEVRSWRREVIKHEVVMHQMPRRRK